MNQSTHQLEQRTRRTKGTFRTDINGLRALAVIPVVAFHAGMLAIPGGFIGVDIFFVISGFLITGILVREAEASGRVALGRFWAKRLRRLVPALTLVVGLTLPLALTTSSPLVWGNLSRDAAASILYVSNFVFALDSTDYFADDLTQSPFLHTWSLGVEEQFYALWPVLVILAIFLARRSKFTLRRTLVFLFVAVIVLSFVLSIVVTDFRQGFAFYLLPTRAWEFAAGGLLSIVPTTFLTRGRTCNSALALTGMAVLLAGFLAIHDNEPFPGSLAVIPVVGTLMVIAAGSGRNAPTHVVAKALDSRMLQWVGTRSYSWYLWHWPVIVLAGVFFQSDSIWLKIGSAVLSLLLAALTYEFIENRFRYAPRLVKSTKRTFIAAGASLLIVCIVAGAATMAARSITSTPSFAKFVQARAVVSDQSCDRSSTTETGMRLCEMGDIASKTTIMLVGDSHAGHWKAAIDEAATQSNIRLLVRWMSACPVSGLSVATSSGNRVKGCTEFTNETLAIALEVRPAAIILAQSVDYSGRLLSDHGRQLAGHDEVKLWRSAFAAKIAEFQATGANVGIIEDNPGTTFDSILCETRLFPNEKDCTSTRAELLTEPLRSVNDEVAADAQVRAVYSPTDDICGPDTCEVVSQDGVPIYRDRTHLSEQWTKAQVPKLGDFISLLVK
ncbi:acyltransferase family protein [Arthrobacter sp. RT-1]|uniref:acyltransferase family protein n=1 Tax=Arthrobacter sp. RT-1 TaxID=2292263 RepID=UPI0015F167B6|nr:acyltransferase family protein [Arthrobacter sp. RT-1]